MQNKYKRTAKKINKNINITNITHNKSAKDICIFFNLIAKHLKKINDKNHKQNKHPEHVNSIFHIRKIK